MFNSNFVKGMVAKFKSQFIPIRDDKMGIYLPTGDLAYRVKPEAGEEISAYRVFLNGALTEVPAAVVSTKFPVYRINKPIDKLEAGDIIRTGDEKKFTYRRIDSIVDGKVSTTSFGGNTGRKIIAITDLMTGTATVSVAINLLKGCSLNQEGALMQNPMAMMMLAGDSDTFDNDDDALTTMFMLQMLNGNQAQNQANPMANMLPFMLLGDGKADMKTIALMSTMSGNQQGNMNNMLPLLLVGDKNSDSLETLLMMQMFSGNQTNNPFMNLFGTTPVATTTAEA